MGLLLLLTINHAVRDHLACLVPRESSIISHYQPWQKLRRRSLAGRLDYRVDVSSANEIGDLVRSFNRMAEDLEGSRRQIEASSRDLLSAANSELDQRRRQTETIMENIPTTCCLSDGDLRIPHVNQALRRMFHPDGNHDEPTEIMVGASLPEVLPPEVLEDFEPILRRSDRMGMTTSQMEIQLPRGTLNVAVTVATLKHQGDNGSGYVIVFEDFPTC